jgi:iron(III) transport system ATP-binding protein
MSLTLRDISHHYGAVAAVEGAGFEAAPGEILCLFGPSGCGKTTLLRIAAGLERLQSGSVELNGKVLAAPGKETPPERRPIGFVFQDLVLFPHMTVEKNIAFGLSADADDAKARIAAQIKTMRLDGLAKRYPHELSGGQQQRTALARALIRGPKALLLDEPFASVDAVLRRRLREDLRRILKEQSVAVVLVTHDPEEALALGDRIALMRDGHIVETQTPAALFEAPQTPEGAMIFPGSQTLYGAIERGKLITAFGDLDAEGLADGPGMAVLRQGAISTERDPEGACQITDARFAGPGWMVDLISDLTADLAGAGTIRVAMSQKPRIGARVNLSFAGSGIFIYKNQ